MKTRLCFTCYKETTNPKFCSRSCSAINTNRNYSKRPTRLTKKCRSCRNLIAKKYQRCNTCRQKYNNRPGDKTLEQIMIKRGHRSLVFAGVRDRAKTIARRLGWNKCICCGYDKFVEICHIKPISSFPLDTKVSTINGLDNIIPLCPNCHWEFDHKIMDNDRLNKVETFINPAIGN